MHEAADSEIGLRVAAGNRLRVDTGRKRTSFGACVKRPANIHRRLAQAPLLWVLSTRRFAKTIFLFAGLLFVGRCHRGVVSVPPEPCRGWWGFEGRRAPLKLATGCFLFGAFPLLLPGEFLSPRAICYPQAHPQKIARQHYDVFGSGRGTSTLNLQSEFFVRPAAVSRVRRSKVFSLTGLESFSLVDRGLSLQPVRAFTFEHQAEFFGPARARWPFARGRRPVDGPARRWLSCGRRRRLCDRRARSPPAHATGTRG